MYDRPTIRDPPVVPSGNLCRMGLCETISWDDQEQRELRVQGEHQEHWELRVQGEHQELQEQDVRRSVDVVSHR